MKKRTAVLLFTLPAEAEGRRKDWCASPTGKKLLERMIQRLAAGVEALPGFDLILSAPCATVAGRSVQIRQSGRSFGAELHASVAATFARGYGKVLVVGNDAPDLSPAYLSHAARTLDGPTPRAVIGTAKDGGYALLGLNRWCPDAFHGISWGTKHVARQTASRLNCAGFSCTELAAIADIDSATDLARWFACGTYRGVRAALAQALAGPATFEAPPQRAYAPRVTSQPLDRGPPALATTAP